MMRVIGRACLAALAPLSAPGSAPHLAAAPPGPPVALPHVPAPTYRIVIARGRDELAGHVEAWDDLAREAAEPNPFHESWFLLPALEAFAHGVTVEFVLVYADHDGSPPRLCGFFPFERARRYRGLPLRHLRLWRPVHAYLGTPLVRQRHAGQVLDALAQWWASDGARAAVVEWSWVALDGAFCAALAHTLESRGLGTWVAQSWTRAMLAPRASVTDYLAEAFSAKARKELRRLGRRLAEGGGTAFRELQPEDDAGRWIADFLALEASGWKGRAGSALGSTTANRSFFVNAASEAARRGRLQMMVLTVAERPVAMRCAFVAGEGAFAFKIAYDEAFARFSPGVLLELEHLQRFHERRQLAWMDSCASPEHFMADRLWIDRRPLATLVTSTGRASGELALALLPLARWLRQKTRREK